MSSLTGFLAKFPAAGVFPSKSALVSGTMGWWAHHMGRAEVAFLSNCSYTEVGSATYGTIGAKSKMGRKGCKLDPEPVSRSAR